MKARIGCARGFTLVEVLVGSAISLAVIAVACQLAADAQVAWRSGSARVDLQQRARVIADLVTRLLREAGAGPMSGPARANLIRGIPPVLPRRVGRRGAHAFDEFRTDAFTVIRAIAESEHGALLTPAASGATTLELSPGRCALTACGFADGVNLMLLDSSGQFDIFTVTAVDGMAVSVRHQGLNPSGSYAAGTPVIAVESASITLDGSSRTLRLYDGDATDLPLLDDVVDLRVAYFGEGEPPVWPRPPDGEANCLYAADGTYQSALLPVLGTPGRLIELTAGMLTDGPWCSTGDTRFDADLLRVRRMRVSVRLQAGDAAVRGTDRARFANPGSAWRSALFVPDVTVAIDVAPRNLRLE
jgi:prepilin-type N-terminal cleavage/methylation domain-containing protein